MKEGAFSMGWVAVAVALLLAACSSAEAATSRLYLPLAAQNTAMGTAPTAAPTVVPTSTPIPTVAAVPTAVPTQVPGLTLNQIIDLIDGSAVLYSEESPAVYLGLVSSNCFLADSITNSFGRYGNQFSALSIRDSFGAYGSPFQPYSAFNQFSFSPPVAWVPSGTGYTAFAYVTTNTLKTPRVDSAYLVDYLRQKGGCF